ncbi:MAG: TIGR00180 family glycosyltransferase [Puniceicoccales bacterium]|jgi:glycosyltransferase domain-containing protein|nr:TIGR00180 family glycosyltransferase [Puniceicoccales bacterium]
MNYDKNLASKLSIFLPLKGRPLFTLRYFLYMEAVECPFHILIADGSLDEENKKIIDDNKHRFSHVSFEYLRYPPDNTILDFERKMADALSKINTPYVVWHNNDDFSIVGSMLECIKFIDKDEKGEFVACGGPAYQFMIHKNKPFGNFTSNFVCKNKKDGVLSLDTKSRVLSSMPFYQTIIQNVILRTDTFHQAYRELVKHNITDLLVSEYFLVRYLLCKGKYKILHNTPYWFYQTNTSVWQPEFFLKKVLLGSFLEEHKITMHLIAEQIVQSSSLDLTSANISAIQTELEEHFVKSLNAKTLKDFIQLQTDLLNCQFILQLIETYRGLKNCLMRFYWTNLKKYSWYLFVWLRNPRLATHVLQSVSAFQKVSKHLPDDIKGK